MTTPLEEEELLNFFRFSGDTEEMAAVGNLSFGLFRCFWACEKLGDNFFLCETIVHGPYSSPNLS